MARRRTIWTVALQDGGSSSTQTFESEYQAQKHYQFLVGAWTENARNWHAPAHVEQTTDEFRIVSDVSVGKTLVSIEMYPN